MCPENRTVVIEDKNQIAAEVNWTVSSGETVNRTLTVGENEFFI